MKTRKLILVLKETLDSEAYWYWRNTCFLCQEQFGRLFGLGNCAFGTKVEMTISPVPLSIDDKIVAIQSHGQDVKWNYGYGWRVGMTDSVCSFLARLFPNKEICVCISVKKI